MTSPLPALDRFRNLLTGKAVNDARFQHVLEQMPNAAFIIQPKSGLFVASNARAAALTGWTREEVAEQSLAEVVAAPDAVKQLHDLQPGESAQLRDIPLRVRVGRPPEKVDLRATAFLDHNGETALLTLLTPSAERRLQERERSTFDVALHELQRLPVLFESPTPA
ncbi:MAG: PAS domain-containing protein, partial [Anaerolineales bacterium]|nr:PAS domain-containing protein [Anaerolineales bacterium]